MISISSFFLFLRCKFFASFAFVLVSFSAVGKPFNDLEVSFSHGKSFISKNKISSGKPAEIFKNYRLLLQFPYAVLVSNDSYLELVKKDEIQLRVGQSSVLEFISPNHLNAMQGAFLLYSKNDENWKISSNEATLSLKGRGTWMFEKTESGDLKIILLEGKGLASLDEEEKKLSFGELLLLRTSPKNELSHPITLELPLLLATSRLINNYETILHSKPRLVSAAKVQIVRLKKRYQALVGGTNEQSELRMWAIRKSTEKNNN